MEGALHLHLDIGLTPPASWSKKKRRRAECGEHFPSVRPDLDNYVKAVMDGMACCWGDDAQVVSLVACKRYSVSPGVNVLLRHV
jgi:Holliday junction resolvase RusA-like endonuclease